MVLTHVIHFINIFNFDDMIQFHPYVSFIHVWFSSLSMLLISIMLNASTISSNLFDLSMSSTRCDKLLGNGGESLSYDINYNKENGRFYFILFIVGMFEASKIKEKCCSRVVCLQKSIKLAQRWVILLNCNRTCLTNHHGPKAPPWWIENAYLIVTKI